jgi:uncharacterized membrane protein
VRPVFVLPFMLFSALGLFLFLVLAFVLAGLGLVSVAFAKLGLSGPQTFFLLLATLIGAGVNLPAWRTGRVVPARAARFLPLSQPGQPGELVDQVVAVNLGGCVIPVLLCLYFISQIGASPALGLAVLGAAAICYVAAKPKPGVGIAVPLFIPPIAAALGAVILAPAGQEPQVAYVAGSLGTLLGADIAHMLKRSTMDRLDAPVLSIGGAGTFNGIFVAGVLAVLLA